VFDIKGMPGRFSYYVNPMISLAQLIKLALGSSAVSRECGCAYLRYAEVDGYYLEHRIRALDPALISDAKCLE
jgi:hypothetical protein